MGMPEVEDVDPWYDTAQPGKAALTFSRPGWRLQNGEGARPMLARTSFSVIAATAMAVAILDLTGSVAAAAAASMLPLLLGLSNLMPFAAWALPAATATVALGARLAAHLAGTTLVALEPSAMLAAAAINP
jgi:hypothetical protein